MSRGQRSEARGQIYSQPVGRRSRPLLSVLCSLSSVLCPLSSVPAATASWDANSEPDIAGYLLDYGRSSGAYDNEINLMHPVPLNGSVSVSVDGLQPGVTYYFAVIAYSEAGIPSPYSSEVSYTQPATEIVPQTVVSRRIHGPAGTFDIALPLTGSPGIECRSGGKYTIIATFASTVTFAGATLSGTGTITSATVDGSQITVQLAGVGNVQTITLNLNQVSNGSATNDVLIPIGILVGDVTNNRHVDAADRTLVRRQNGRPVDSTNFREDVVANGHIDSADVAVTKRNSGTGLP